MRIAITEKKIETLANHIEAYGMAGTAHQLRGALEYGKSSGGFFLTRMMPKLYMLRDHIFSEAHRKDNEYLRNLLDEFLLWVEHGFMNSEDMILEARNAYEVMPLAWDRGQALLNIIDRELGSKAGN